MRHVGGVAPVNGVTQAFKDIKKPVEVDFNEVVTYLSNAIYDESPVVNVNDDETYPIMNTQGDWEGDWSACAFKRQGDLIVEKLAEILDDKGVPNEVMPGKTILRVKKYFKAPVLEGIEKVAVNSIKEVLEGFYYKLSIKKAEMSSEDFNLCKGPIIDAIRNAEFKCAPGGYDDLQGVMVKASSMFDGNDSLMYNIKYQTLKMIAAEYVREDAEILEWRYPNLTPTQRIGNEKHFINELLKSVADEYNIVIEDVYATKIFSWFSDDLKDRLARNYGINFIIKTMQQEILGFLPDKSALNMSNPMKYNEAIISIDRVLKLLSTSAEKILPINVILTENGDDYKPSHENMIELMVISYLQSQGFINIKLIDHEWMKAAIAMNDKAMMGEICNRMIEKSDEKGFLQHLYLAKMWDRDELVDFMLKGRDADAVIFYLLSLAFDQKDDRRAELMINLAKEKCDFSRCFGDNGQSIITLLMDNQKKVAVDEILSVAGGKDIIHALFHESAKYADGHNMGNVIKLAHKKEILRDYFNPQEVGGENALVRAMKSLESHDEAILKLINMGYEFGVYKYDVRPLLELAVARPGGAVADHIMTVQRNIACSKGIDFGQDRHLYANIAGIFAGAGKWENFSKPGLLSNAIESRNIGFIEVMLRHLLQLSYESTERQINDARERIIEKGAQGNQSAVQKEKGYIADLERMKEKLDDVVEMLSRIAYTTSVKKILSENSITPTYLNAMASKNDLTKVLIRVFGARALSFVKEMDHALQNEFIKVMVLNFYGLLDTLTDKDEYQECDAESVSLVCDFTDGVKDLFSHCLDNPSLHYPEEAGYGHSLKDVALNIFRNKMQREGVLENSIRNILGAEQVDKLIALIAELGSEEELTHTIELAKKYEKFNPLGQITQLILQADEENTIQSFTKLLMTLNDLEYDIEDLLYQYAGGATGDQYRINVVLEVAMKLGVAEKLFKNDHIRGILEEKVRGILAADEEGNINLDLLNKDIITIVAYASDDLFNECLAVIESLGASLDVEIECSDEEDLLTGTLIYNLIENGKTEFLTKILERLSKQDVSNILSGYAWNYAMHYKDEHCAQMKVMADLAAQFGCMSEMLETLPYEEVEGFMAIFIFDGEIESLKIAMSVVEIEDFIGEFPHDGLLSLAVTEGKKFADTILNYAEDELDSEGFLTMLNNHNALKTVIDCKNMDLFERILNLVQGKEGIADLLEESEGLRYAVIDADERWLLKIKEVACSAGHKDDFIKFLREVNEGILQLPEGRKDLLDLILMEDGVEELNISTDSESRSNEGDVSSLTGEHSGDDASVINESFVSGDELTQSECNSLAALADGSDSESVASSGASEDSKFDEMFEPLLPSGAVRIANPAVPMTTRKVMGLGWTEISEDEAITVVRSTAAAAAAARDLPVPLAALADDLLPISGLLSGAPLPPMPATPKKRGFDFANENGNENLTSLKRDFDREDEVSSKRARTI